MPRLPIPGSDQGSWGQILNDYLSQSHQADGTLKAGSVNGSSLADGSVTQAKLSATGGTSGQVLSTDGTSLSWSTPTGSGTVPDASSSVKGLVQLAGDLGGTAAAPTVPGLAGKANTTHAHAIADVTNLQTTLNGKAATVHTHAIADVTNLQTSLDAKAADNAVVHLTGNETVTGVKNFTGTLQIGGQAAVATNDTRLSDQRVPTNASVTTAKLAAANSPTNGQILSYNGTQFNWVAAPAGGGDPVMGGDISGTASAATIAANAVTTTKIADSNVTTAKIANDAVTEPKLAASNTPSNGQVLSWNGTSLAWAAPTVGGGGLTAVAVSTTYTASNNEFIVANASAAGFTITLPAASNGGHVYIKKVDATVNAIIVVPVSGQIDGTASVVANQQWEGLDLFSDGTKWYNI